MPRIARIPRKKVLSRGWSPPWPMDCDDLADVVVVAVMVMATTDWATPIELVLPVFFFLS